MTHYQDIYEVAADNYGIITSAQAKELGIVDKEMSAIAARGRIYRIGYGVYRITDYIPVPNDPYADAVALVGDESYLYGESVIAMHSLAPTNPTYIYVATPRRVRKKLPGYLKVVNGKDGYKSTEYEGIRSQTIADAIRTCKASMMPSRLLKAVSRARAEGYLTKSEAEVLRKELS